MTIDLPRAALNRAAALARVDEIREALDQRLPPLPSRADVDRIQSLLDEANGLLNALPTCH